MMQMMVGGEMKQHLQSGNTSLRLITRSTGKESGIRRQRPTLNRDGSYDLPAIFESLLYTFLLLSVTKPEMFMLNVIYEITVKARKKEKIK